ncbi:DUF1622 domain-containing protein [Palleronia abyssalis]|uniref:DUF1622 domain-containing protein n=1 Tax=Palleronia abyssalis TaxID=1501240 RepID=A0A2R8BRW6_9RHOB|nr:DUF1622 domain-containing protein [Palleronia abyssalis]SPJ22914.1 hypothetical protein PAA8504_00713 [Palleronia abyssalis]
MESESEFLGYAREGGALHGELAWLVHGLEWVATVVDLLAIAILVLGAVRFVLGFVLAELQRDGVARVRGINRQRVALGRYILAGLELLIVSDIVHTALSLAMIDLVFLGLLVVIRSLISFFLDRELEAVKHDLANGDITA